MQSLTVTVAPVATSISTAELKAHLRLNTSAEDSLLSDWLFAADDLFARTTGRVLVSQTVRLALDAWPDGVMYLPVGPVSSITSVEYLDPDGVWQTLSGTSTDLASVPARVVLPGSLPSTHPTAVPRVRVTFVAGGSPPALAKQAVKLLASHWYAVRESHSEVNLSDVPMGWRHVCGMFDSGVRGVWNEWRTSYAGR